MQLAKLSRNMLPLALSAVLATCALAQDHPNIQPNAVRDQLNKAPAPAQPPAAPPASLAKQPSPAATQTPAKAPAKAPSKASAKTPAKAPADVTASGKAVSANSGKSPVAKVAEERAVVRRDPFDTLLTKARAGNAPPENLPPGKAGLMVETLRINGIVRSPNGMIAIVSNAQQRVYFLREGDKLYDGSVQKIALDAISFSETGKDAFGKPLERVVTKRLYPSPGEQQ
jgi:hypothetical protein